MRGKILIVESDFKNELAALTAIEEVGHEGMVVSNVEEALEVINREDLLAVLTDVNLPLKKGKSDSPYSGESVIQSCIDRVIPVALVTQAAIGCYTWPGIKILVPNFFTAVEPGKDFSWNLIKEIDCQEKDVNVWKDAWKILSLSANPVATWQPRKRLRKNHDRNKKNKKV